MTSGRFVLCFFLLAALGIAGTDPVNFTGLYASKDVPIYDNGYVVGWDESGSRTLSLYAPDGHKLYETSLKLADSTSAFAVGCGG